MESSDSKPKRIAWANDDKVELVKLRIQGLTFRDIGKRIGRTRHATRSEYGRIRRGETDVSVSLKDMRTGTQRALPLETVLNDPFQPLE